MASSSPVSGRRVTPGGPAGGTAPAHRPDPGPSSVWAAVKADSTLGGTVQDADVTEATGYGLMNWAGIDYLACHLIFGAMI
jgi:hypothetical protein